MKNKKCLTKDNNKPQVPFNVFKKAMITTCLSATLIAGSMGFLTGCDNESIPDEVGFANLTLYSGEETPNIADNPGKLGDFYFETDTFNLYKYSEENGWENLGSLQGTDGVDGTNGSKLYSGTAVPTTSNTPAEDGDYYVQTGTFDFYQFDTSEWVKKGCLKGKDGSQITIGGDGYWYIDGVKQNVKATGEKGDPGITPNVGSNGNWWVGATDTGIAVTSIPEIIDGVWYVDGNSTGVEATGDTPTIGANGNWWIGGVDTGKASKGDKGEDAKYIVSAERITDSWGIETKFKFTFSDSSYIETNSFNNLIENYYYPARTVQDINNLFSKGAENIQLENDITTTTAIVFPTGTADNVKDITIDLNNFEFNYRYEDNADDAQRLKIKEYTIVTFKDGNINIETELGYTHATLRVMEKGSVVFDNVNYTSNGSAIVVWGAEANDSQVVKVRNSNIVGGAYALSTQNQHQDPTTGVVIELENSSFTSSVYEIEDDIFGYDTTGILINIPCTTTIKDCTITGQRQAAIVRSGNVTIEDCTLISTGLELTNSPNARLYNTPIDGVYPNWIDDGNDIPVATLVVGNYGNNAYNRETTLNLINSNIIAKKFSQGGEIWAQANQGEGAQPVTINYTTTGELGYNFAVSNFIGAGVNVNIDVNDLETFENILNEASSMFQGANILPVLTKDMVITDDNLTVEDKLRIENYNSSLPEQILRGYQFYTPIYDMMTNFQVYVKTSAGLEYALENYTNAGILLLNDIVYEIDFSMGIDASDIMSVYSYNYHDQIDTNNYAIYIAGFDFNNPATVNVSTAEELMTIYSVYDQYQNFSYSIHLTQDIDLSTIFTADTITYEDVNMINSLKYNYINNYDESPEPQEGFYKIICPALQDFDYENNVKVSTVDGLEQLLYNPNPNLKSIYITQDLDFASYYNEMMEYYETSWADATLQDLIRIQNIVDMANSLNTSDYSASFNVERYHSYMNLRVESAEELKYALEHLTSNGNTITLKNNINSENAIAIYSTEQDINAYIDLGGYSINHQLNLYAKNGHQFNISINNGSIGQISQDVWYGLAILGDDNLFNVNLQYVSVSGYYAGLITNGRNKNTGTIRATNCLFKGAEECVDDTSSGAYLPGGASYEFINCIFYGYDGIYTKNGNLTLNNCTVVGIGAFNEATYNGNGSTGTGSALIIDSAQGYGSVEDILTVNIIGGTLASKFGFDIYEVSTANAGAEETVYYAMINLMDNVQLVDVVDDAPINDNEISKENDEVILNGELGTGYTIVEDSTTFWNNFTPELPSQEPTPSEPGVDPVEPPMDPVE